MFAVPVERSRIIKALLGLVVCAGAAAVMPGCTLVPTTEFNTCQAENRNLSDQNRAQLAELENLKVHSRDLEDRVIRSERQLARLQEQGTLDQKQLETYQHERDGLYEQFKGMAFGRGRMPPELGRQLADLSQRYPNLQFDPATGISKLDTDILFDSGEATLKPGAERLLDELARVLRSSAAGELKIMVTGHTDNQVIVGSAVREKYPNNFHLSTGRALAVADWMRRAGVPEQRLAVAGFGPYQPIATNATAGDRQKNRRVEILVMAADVPVVGWSESTPSVYGTGVRR
jgi:chemotaxis protein MotB